MMQRLRFEKCDIRSNGTYPYSQEQSYHSREFNLKRGWTQDQADKYERYQFRLNGQNASPDFVYVVLKAEPISEEISSGEEVQSCLIDILITSDNRIHFEVQVNHSSEKQLEFEVDPQTLTASILSKFSDVVQEYKFA